jgi:hypothetical protein
MTAPQQDPIRLAGIPVGGVVDVLRSEPALAWFVAQGLWLSQPVLEIFWPQEQITQVAEMLETAGSPARERQLDGGDREEHKGP